MAGGEESLSAESLPGAETVVGRPAPAGCHHCGVPLGRQPEGVVVVVMFVTLLGGARYLELLAHRRATAAIGMSLSSLAVAGNALRLGRKPGAAGS